MNLIFNNQISIFEDIFYKYLTPKQCTKLYTSNLILYNIYNTNNKFEYNYFTPKTSKELEDAVDKRCKNKEEGILKYGHISNWNTKYITCMSGLFNGKQNFNNDISDWNVSNVQNMRGMFFNATNFNQKLNNWDMGNVCNISMMFYNAINFNQNLNNWNLFNIKYTYHTFDNCKNFNPDNCKDWDLSNIEYKSNMFDKFIILFILIIFQYPILPYFIIAVFLLLCHSYTAVYNSPLFFGIK